MQYPKQEYQTQDRTIDLLKATFNSIDEILLLFQDKGVVLEINKLADECCHKSHPFNVGDLLWKENLWLSEWDRKKCHKAFQTALSGKDAEFRAEIKNSKGKSLILSFQY